LYRYLFPEDWMTYCLAAPLVNAISKTFMVQARHPAIIGVREATDETALKVDQNWLSMLRDTYNK